MKTKLTLFFFLGVLAVQVSAQRTPQIGQEKHMAGYVSFAQDGVVILTTGREGTGTPFAITNGPVLTTGKFFQSYVKFTGVYDRNGTPLELWDCNLAAPAKPVAVYVPPPPLTPEQIAARKAAEKAALQKSFFTIQRMATNGEVSAQCSLGLRYLNGMGCETNREQAIFWLQKSAAQGDIEASNKLVSLKK
jgi:hypothetical protein